MSSAGSGTGSGSGTGDSHSAASALQHKDIDNAPIPPMELTSLTNQAYCFFAPYRIRDTSGAAIPASPAILLAWSQKLKSRASSEIDRKNAELLESIAKGITADPYNDDSWVPLMRHFSAAGTHIPADELSTFKRDLGVWEEIRPPTDEQEFDEDIAGEDALVASLTAEQLASQVLGDPVLTVEQRNKLLGL